MSEIDQPKKSIEQYNDDELFELLMAEGDGSSFDPENLWLALGSEERSAPQEQRVKALLDGLVEKGYCQKDATGSVYEFSPILLGYLSKNPTATFREAMAAVSNAENTERIAREKILTAVLDDITATILTKRGGLTEEDLTQAIGVVSARLQTQLTEEEQKMVRVALQGLRGVVRETSADGSWRYFSRTHAPQERIRHRREEIVKHFLEYVAKLPATGMWAGALKQAMVGKKALGHQINDEEFSDLIDGAIAAKKLLFENGRWYRFGTEPSSPLRADSERQAFLELQVRRLGTYARVLKDLFAESERRPLLKTEEEELVISLAGVQFIVESMLRHPEMHTSKRLTALAGLLRGPLAPNENIFPYFWNNERGLDPADAALDNQKAQRRRSLIRFLHETQSEAGTAIADGFARDDVGTSLGVPMQPATKQEEVRMVDDATWTTVEEPVPAREIGMSEAVPNEKKQLGALGKKLSAIEAAVIAFHEKVATGPVSKKEREALFALLRDFVATAEECARKGITLAPEIRSHLAHIEKLIAQNRVQNPGRLEQAIAVVVDGIYEEFIRKYAKSVAAAAATPTAAPTPGAATGAAPSSAAPSPTATPAAPASPPAQPASTPAAEPFIAAEVGEGEPLVVRLENGEFKNTYVEAFSNDHFRVFFEQFDAVRNPQSRFDPLKKEHREDFDRALEAYTVWREATKLFTKETFKVFGRGLGVDLKKEDPIFGSVELALMRRIISEPKGVQQISAMLAAAEEYPRLTEEIGKQQAILDAYGGDDATSSLERKQAANRIALESTEEELYLRKERLRHEYEILRNELFFAKRAVELEKVPLYKRLLPGYRAQRSRLHQDLLAKSLGRPTIEETAGAHDAIELRFNEVRTRYQEAVKEWGTLVGDYERVKDAYTTVASAAAAKESLRLRAARIRDSVFNRTAAFAEIAGAMSERVKELLIGSLGDRATPEQIAGARAQVERFKKKLARNKDFFAEVAEFYGDPPEVVNEMDQKIDEALQKLVVRSAEQFAATENPEVKFIEEIKAQGPRAVEIAARVLREKIAQARRAGADSKARGRALVLSSFLALLIS
jgi:cell division septation protein DedD